MLQLYKNFTVTSSVRVEFRMNGKRKSKFCIENNGLLLDTIAHSSQSLEVTILQVLTRLRPGFLLLIYIRSCPANTI